MQSFQELVVWQRSHQLTLALLTDPLVVHDFRARTVAEQAWRAGCSVSANIAEGAGSASQAQFARYLGLALASAHELENHLMLATDAGMLAKPLGDRRLDEVRQIKRMLWTLRERVQRASQAPQLRKPRVRPPPSPLEP